MVLQEQARLIRENSIPALIGTQLSMGFVALNTWMHEPRREVMIAFFLFSLLQFGRTGYILLADRKGLVDRRPDIFIFWGSIGSFSTGFCWMVTPFLCWSIGGGWAGVTATISVAGVSAGAVLLSASRATYALLYAMPALFGSFLLFLLQNSSDGYVLAIATVLFGLLMTVCAFRSEALVVRNIRLAFERSRLVSSLEIANQRAQAAVQQFEFLAMHDPLTGLLNRSAIGDQFQARIGEAVVSGTRVGVMVLDLDHFKQINDLFGHPVGDRLLVEAAARIKSVLRSDALVGRLGGDEFAIVFDMTTSEVGTIAQSLIDVMSAPFPLGGRPVNVGLSIGVALCPDHGETIDLLMSRADIALYAAKHAGRLRWAMFSDRLGDRARDEQEIEAELRVALRSGQIRYHYQPQVAVTDRRLIGLEALLRWDHPVRGRIPPNEVIAAAQRSNQVEALIGCALKDACLMLRRLDAAGHGDVRVALNISPRDFELCNVATLVETALLNHQVSAARLEIEITEDAILEGEMGGPQLERLERLGVPLAVDDFGVGYSSIARLKDLKIDRLKIDRRFVIDIERSQSVRMLFEAIAAVGRSLKIELLAEGIENIEQLQVIAALGCDVAQGFLFAPALSPDDAIAWLTREQPRIAV